MLIYAANSDSFQNRQRIRENSVTTTGFSKISNFNELKLRQRSKVLSLSGGLSTDTFLTTAAILKTTLLSNPSNLFNSMLVALLSLTGGFKIIDSLKRKSSTSNQEKKPQEVSNLQSRFLVVFWLLRMADWLQGPYFYEVYSSKIINGVAATPDLVSKLFLVGFASTGILGPWIGRFVDNFGRKAGTLAFALFYTLGALSTASSNLLLLLLGRFSSGIGTSLLHSAPEAWLVGDHQKNQFDGKWLGQTFGWAYAGDSLVAITAGQLAAAAAGTQFGASGPFLLSLLFLFSGGSLAALLWKENVATKSPTTNTNTNNATIKSVSVSDALSVMLKDKRVMLVGAVQALFEGAMYIFVLQWPPAIKSAILQSNWLGQGSIPYGTIFSCFMASCLLGSTLFSQIQSKIQSKIEVPASLMLLTASIAMIAASLFGSTNLAILASSFFIFEACVGMYFPTIGTLRSKYIPDSHRSIIMNLFGVPLNLIVISVFLSINRLGVQGALGCASIALTIATICMSTLSLIKK